MTWRERIQAARERGKFTKDDVDDAACWCTCAVGEQHIAMPEVVLYDLSWPNPCLGHDLIHEEFHGTPLRSQHLRSPGLLFMRAVRDGDFDLADSLLDAIEDRALALKREFRDVDGVSPEPGSGDAS